MPDSSDQPTQIPVCAVMTRPQGDAGKGLRVPGASAPRTSCGLPPGANSGKRQRNSKYDRQTNCCAPIRRPISVRYQAVKPGDDHGDHKDQYHGHHHVDQETPDIHRSTSIPSGFRAIRPLTGTTHALPAMPAHRGFGRVQLRSVHASTTS